MQKTNSAILYSASDIVNFLECKYLTNQDLINLGIPQHKTENKAENALIQAKGIEHEKAYLNSLINQGLNVADLSSVEGTNEDKAIATLDALNKGYDIIYQATFLQDNFIGFADFLCKVGAPSKLGDYSYEVVDTKLSRTSKAKFVIQLAFYSKILANIQGVVPEYMHIVLGNNKKDSFKYSDYTKYYDNLQSRFLKFVEKTHDDIYPSPCNKCSECKWQDSCGKKWQDDDHLHLVANITKTQIHKLNSAGIHTLEALAKLPEDTEIAKLEYETLSKLRLQANIQYRARISRKNEFEILPNPLDKIKGFARLPFPNDGDMFFDMEGDPLENGGLEYLFGLYILEDGIPQFKTFWAHNRAEEKIAFENFIDFVYERLNKYPNAHIYHYASYEESALKKLMTMHATREVEVDNLLRHKKLVDLYKVVREGILISEPRYSIKNVEHFYRGARSGDVKNATASIVYYDEWKKTQDESILKQIADYNFDDVESTYQLREWLLSIRPSDIQWFIVKDDADENSVAMPESEANKLIRERLEYYQHQLLDNLPANRNSWGDEEHFRELLFYLLDFHRREDKPEWWALFARMDADFAELLEDTEAIVGLVLDTTIPPIPEKKSFLYTYNYPLQETKLNASSKNAIINLANQHSVDIFDIKTETGQVVLKLSPKKEIPEELSISKGAPIDNKIMREAIFRFADSIIAKSQKYKAIEDILMRRRPNINGYVSGTSIINESQEILPQVISAINNLQNSHLFLQGTPGAGKTYIGSNVIASLLKSGKRVGIASNSHHAIINMLQAIEKVANSQNISFNGIYKSSEKEINSLEQIKIANDNKDVFKDNPQLVAGTAWLFSRPEANLVLDYLFIDEAGQVSLANMIAMGTSCANIILLGDQMQLSQPLKGSHPGQSGESTLDYLLQGRATIPPTQGIFLNTTYRMNPKITSFISEAFYDKRLEAVTHNKNQQLVLNEDHDIELIKDGILYIPINHDACSQSSKEEAVRIKDIYYNLLLQSYQDKHGNICNIGIDDILVVAPYNIQINLLTEYLPESARVGTIDKFQGQEAEVVIISMTTSSDEYLPRDIGFLFSKNRLNVAISRAKCLAIVIANPELMATTCSKPEEISLVNTLCWLQEFLKKS